MAKTRVREFIRKCPDGCGKDEYDLGLYRGFHLYQKPFFDGWYVYAETVHPGELDKLLLKEFEGLSGKICLDTETSEHFTVEQCEQYVIETIDKFWDKKQRLITKDAEEAKQKFLCLRRVFTLYKERKYTDSELLHFLAGWCHFTPKGEEEEKLLFAVKVDKTK